MAKVPSIKEEASTEVTSRMINSMAFSGLRVKMVKFMMESGKIIKRMVMAYMNGQMAAIMKAPTTRTKNMGGE